MLRYNQPEDFIIGGPVVPIQVSVNGNPTPWAMVEWKVEKVLPLDGCITASTTLDLEDCLSDKKNHTIGEFFASRRVGNKWLVRWSMAYVFIGTIEEYILDQIANAE